MKRSIIFCVFACACGVAAAGDAPSIGGSATISANIEGGVVNGGEAMGGAQVTLKQSVASVVKGDVGGELKLDVNVKGAIANAGVADAGAQVVACQSIGSIGSDC